jgi:LDH2 family malate/lactate/ureidoglycolate dehydrogenase
MATTHHFQASYLHAVTRQMLMAAGTPQHIADDVAEILVKANLTGHDSHGVLRIPAYLRGIAEGRIIPAAEPEVTTETANTLHIDGHDGFGHYIARRGVTMAIEKAKQVDLCGVSFVRTGHIGRLGEYAEAAARAGCIGIITYGFGGKNNGRVVPFGGAGGVMSTNPIAVGVPTGDASPFVLDIATSVVAEGKLQVARSKNADLPEGYIVDKQGRPSIKPADFYEGGFLLPFGGHKGYGLGLVVALLGGLSGKYNLESGVMNGEFMLIINVNAFTPLEDYQQGVRVFLDGIKSTPPAPGFNEVLVPGDFEARSRARRLVEGVEMPDTIYQELQEWAGKLGVSIEKDIVELADAERYRGIA